jgi:hypothetical protein
MWLLDKYSEILDYISKFSSNHIIQLEHKNEYR